MKVSKSGAGLPFTFRTVRSYSLSVLTTWTLKSIPIALASSATSFAAWIVEGRLRADVEVEGELLVALGPGAVAVLLPAGVVEDLLRLLGVERVVLRRHLVERLVEGRQDPVTRERGVPGGDLVDALAVDRVGDRLANGAVLDRGVELRVRAVLLRAKVERQLGVGRRGGLQGLDVRLVAEPLEVGGGDLGHQVDLAELQRPLDRVLVAVA